MSATAPPTHFWAKMKWWWRSRDWRSTPRWAPAILATLSLVVVAALYLNTTPGELQARYLTEAKSAFRAKDYARALTCYERIAPSCEDRPEVLYQLALTAEAAGDYARASTAMRELAPDDHKGYAPAHYWWAVQVLVANPNSPRSIAAAEVHLLRALDGELEDRDSAHGLLGKIYFNTGRLEQAEFHLAKAVSSNASAANAQFRLPLAAVFHARGNAAKARQETEVAVRFFRDKSRSDPTNIHLRLAWAEAVTALEDFPQAIDILKEGLAISGADVFHLFIARVYVAWYDLRKKDQSAPAGELISLLDKGLNSDPSNKDLLNRTIEQLRFGGANADECRKTLQTLLAKGGTALAPIHFALAVDARVCGDAASEKIHLEEAYRLDPKMSLVANNLAHVLSQPPTADLTRALNLIDAALDREPSNSNYLETRGQIYRSMGRWKEALLDFEIVLSKAPNTNGIHSALAEVYEKLNLPDLAAQHKALAAEAARTKSSTEAAGKKP